MHVPECQYRTELLGGKYQHCGHTRVRGFELDLVPLAWCAKCPQRLVPCEVPRPVPAIVETRWGVHYVNLWTWGQNAKRLIWALTLGLVRPRPKCGCDERAGRLDRGGARCRQAAARGLRRILTRRR